MRRSLGLFGVLAALGAVNVYVFFFNQKTAPREVLKPSSFVDERTNPEEVVRESARDTDGKALLPAEPVAPSPAPSGPARATAPKVRPPGAPAAAAASPARKKVAAAPAAPVRTPAPSLKAPAASVRAPAPFDKKIGALRPAQQNAKPTVHSAVARPSIHTPGRPATAAQPARRTARP